jgi:threonine/homoserine/homoserine lactone efflux protein
MDAIRDLIRRSDPFGVGMFAVVLVVVIAMIVGLGALIVQDGNLQRECVQQGYSYVDGDCIADYRSK